MLTSPVRLQACSQWLWFATNLLRVAWVQVPIQRNKTDFFYHAFTIFLIEINGNKSNLLFAFY
ncbi:MAG: hypothetical protein ACLUIO_16355, partial [Neglectibacter timonensis]